ncbi:LADA_0E00628g1_1 [Lachancea dasiensis]|uniref:LADA_0E00628g1_1 n=1 Tax=Lachancea dasiensis TaxID=1072105 RepID=A0A1G4JA18_9SACH|nr:LADA_0E00628g1_1 [Lachancea dasiensis]
MYITYSVYNQQLTVKASTASSTRTMSSPEKEFITKFVALASVQASGVSADAKVPQQNVTNLGVALPPLRYRYDHRRAKKNATDSATIKLRLKSIRSPKFAHAQDFATSQTIYHVKQHLAEVEESILDSSQLKILLKGKVLHDNMLLSDLKAAEADLVVMVSKFDKQPAVASPPRSEPGITKGEVPWEKIRTLLRAEIPDATQAASTFERLQQGWQATESNDLD